MTEKELEAPLQEDIADDMSGQESPDSTTETEKSDLFVHKSNGKRVGFLGAQRMADKDKGKRWETEEETRERLTPVFELDIKDAVWDDNESQPGLRAVRDKPKRKRPSPAARRRKRKAAEAEAADAMVEPQDPTEEEVSEPSPEESESEPEFTAEDIDEAKAMMEADEEEEEQMMTEEPVEKDGQTILPSVDGERVYDLSGDGRGQQQKALAGLENLFKTWTWDDGLDSLKLKVVEEANELNDGGNEAPVESDGSWTFIGTSAASEALTVAIVALKLLHTQGVPVNAALRLMQMRHEEQYQRYNS
jgi:hypothetical protein